MKTINSLKLLKVKDVAPILGYHEDYVRQLCRQGKIEFMRVGAGYRFTEEQVLNFIKVNGESK